jgi:hypothetical protein
MKPAAAQKIHFIVGNLKSPNSQPYAQSAPVRQRGKGERGPRGLIRSAQSPRQTNSAGQGSPSSRNVESVKTTSATPSTLEPGITGLPASTNLLCR